MASEEIAVDSNDTGSTETGENANSEIVPFHEVGDEDLEAFLNAEMDAEANGGYPSSDPEQPAKEDDALAAQTPAKDSKLDEQTDPNAPLTRAEFNALLDRLNRQEKKVDGQEILIQRRTSELGEAKKQLKHIAATLKERFNEALENGSQAEALDIRDQIKTAEQKFQEAEHEEVALVRRSQAQTLVSAHVPEDQFDIEGMAECLARDGIPPQFIERFKADPIGFVSDGDASPGLTLVHVAKRAQAEGMLKKLYPIAKSLAEEVKRLKGSQGDVLKRVQQVAKQTPQISASGARPTKLNKASTLSEVDIANLSDAELDEFLTNAN